ncbi:MAG: nucleotide exchange factor GrpE [Candidatus Magasanikbacteria bacterium RIFCSPHIGHO2_01_FULL_33_34]|uniref:Protein GrpE n=1 Tax=Candidatus Magasanikbacteria bacterium RIFCSPHIGHO2_01_FULL_33_34 TaxID=1798671 RepID=A0A1F6LKX2_9BACT|nr:MAG: nucleotide exchange factor GrpE [Candidatus Magasanikbacteria bacterium RIFCSPHIGHO2_01_FULL_33_34]OGH65754.1 MAG: nucleotide exchange factor GrpE [Candidatus Magasanikbacteria bacterium RIFCSPHIGHO2_02_FULL_33_17]OGH75120.1 MAG: nucleotide exchange factor GrpE [Candidatus Magasanikbacteria bacterium RIFCSPLOWO2_01_FULL_33_34]OGH81198.1 MAG: nucleotide exchange factor GrpE [Candidatus Magasanikbacteria bacterium RIFCSPLOWO2_12_FULL_34_7]
MTNDKKKDELENEELDNNDNKTSELDEIKAKCEEYKAGWLRAQADYQNLQKEVENKRSEWVKMSEVQILEDFIPVYDNFKKAFGHDIKDGQFDSWKKGIEYIMKQFSDILTSYKIEEIKTVGEIFNPELHEAVGEEEAVDKADGEILKEIDTGYKVGDKIIKCAKVVVNK